MKNRGFTLIEVMVGAVVAILVIGVVMGTFLSQQRAMQTLDLSREASGAGRDALLSLQETIGRAGYGIDPRYAFDLRVYNCTNYSVATTAANACRDKVDAADQLVFVERDPNYYWAGGPTTTFQGCDDTNAPCSGHAWQVTSFTTTSPYRVVINARTGDRFPIGQVVEITCAKGANPQMGTVTAVSGNPPGSVTLTLANPVTNNHYTDNIQGASGTTLHDACFDGNGVSLFLVNRYRYFVMSIVPQQPVGAPVPPAEPWLMLDRGLDYNGNGTTPEPGSTTGCAVGAVAARGAIWNVVIAAISVFGNAADATGNGAASYVLRSCSSCAAFAAFSAGVLPGMRLWFSGFVRSLPCSLM